MIHTISREENNARSDSGRKPIGGVERACWSLMTGRVPSDQDIPVMVECLTSHELVAAVGRGFHQQCCDGDGPAGTIHASYIRWVLGSKNRRTANSGTGCGLMPKGDNSMSERSHDAVLTINAFRCPVTHNMMELEAVLLITPRIVHCSAHSPSYP